MESPLEILLSPRLSQKTFQLERIEPKLERLSLPNGLTVRDALDRVFRLLSVGSKRFLTTKVDRCVTGLAAQQQCVGPLEILPRKTDNLPGSVKAAFKKRPDWFDGAEFLAHHGSRVGLEVLRKAFRGSDKDEKLRASLALLRLGDRSIVPALFEKYGNYQYDPEEEALLAPLLEEKQIAVLYERARTQWQRLTSSPTIRLLAYRGDPGVVLILRRMLRLDSPTPSWHAPPALALARMGVKEAKHDFLRFLRGVPRPRRSNSPARGDGQDRKRVACKR